MWTIIEELNDYKGSIREFIEILERVENKYGENAIIEFDAGHNNVEVLVTPKY